MKYTRICAGITAVAALISLACCKPTEKNYRLAYELAQQKARENLDDAEYAMMLEEEQPPLVHAGDDSIRARTLPLMWQYSPQSLDSGRRADPLRYNLAVGMYTMLTNAKAHADNLVAKGWHSVVFRSGGKPSYYVVAMRSDSLDRVATEARRYIRENPNGIVGMREPVAIMPRR